METPGRTLLPRMVSHRKTPARTCRTHCLPGARSQRQKHHEKAASCAPRVSKTAVRRPRFATVTVFLPTEDSISHSEIYTPAKRYSRSGRRHDMKIPEP